LHELAEALALVQELVLVQELALVQGLSGREYSICLRYLNLNLSLPSQAFVRGNESSKKHEV
jgi:hypothetical protein